MNYEERVRAIAEEMARETYNEPFTKMQYVDVPDIYFVGLPKEEQDFMIDQFMLAARIVVGHMAEAYKDGHHDGWMSKAANHARLNTPTLEEGLLKSGLIPDQESSQFTKFLRGYGGIPDQEAGSQ